jgi:Tol biopolymer transport system component
VPKTGEVSWNCRGLRPAALGLLLLAAASAAGAGQVELVSQADPLPDSYGNSAGPALSTDGRWIVFQSDAPNLVPGQVDGNGSYDVFLRDQVAGTTTLISHEAGRPTTASAVEGVAGYLDTGISADGRYAVFVSLGTRLVPGQNDANKASDVFLYDRVTGTTTLVSHASGDPATTADGLSAGAAISADGNSVVFFSTAGNLVAGQTAPAGPGRANVFLYSRPTGALTLISHAGGSPAAAANDTSAGTAISADGGYVAFWSTATDLLPGVTDTGSSSDVFLWQRATGALTLVSHAGGSPLTPGAGFSVDPQISADGRWIAFRSLARNLVPGETASPGAHAQDIYLFDRVLGQTRLVSHASASPSVAAGIETPDLNTSFAMSADGRWVAFTSSGLDLVAGQVNLAAGGNVFLYDRTADRNTLVSHNRDSQTTSPTSPFSRLPSVSADGRYVAYESAAVDLVPHQTDTANGFDVFLYDRVSQTSVLASHTRASLTTAANGPSEFVRVSADGGTVVFDSYATDLGAGQIDTQRFQDLFLFDRKSAEVTLLTGRDPGIPATTPLGPSSATGISADGRYVLFLSKATGLVPGQVDKPWSRDAVESGNGSWDVFLRDRGTGKTTLLSRSKASPPTATGGDSAVLSAGGGFAAFRVQPTSDPYSSSLMLYDRAADALRLVNHAVSPVSERSGAPGGYPTLSADGRFVAYACSGCLLVPGQRDGSGFFNPTDVFLYDRLSDTHVLVSHASGDPLTTGSSGSGDPWISADGNVVAFVSRAGNLVAGQGGQTGEHAFVFNRATGAIALIDHTAGSPATATGQLTALAGMSADGRWIVFTSDATDLVPGQADTNQKHDLFLYDRLSGATSLISHASASPVTAGNAETYPYLFGLHRSMVSADGRWIVFHSFASDLVAGVSDANDTLDVYLYDRLSGAVSLVSSAAGAPGTPAARYSQNPVISADGSRIGFQSPSPDLLPGQTGTALRFYVQERATGARTLLGPVAGVAYAFDSNVSLDLWMSADGRRTAFTSDAPLVPGDFNANWDAFVYDAAAGPVTVPPCALFDGALRSNVRRTIAVAGACGVPAGAKQAILKLTVSKGTGKGNVQIYPGNVTSPSSGILRFNPGVTRSAGFTLPLGNGAVAVLPFVAGNGTVRVSLEVDGYVP